MRVSYLKWLDFDGQIRILEIMFQMDLLIKRLDTLVLLIN